MRIGGYVPFQKKWSSMYLEIIISILLLNAIFLCYIKISSSVVRYAREDTHYLLYIYDVMRNELLSKSMDGYDHLLEV
jgi:hypothetical protein